MCTHRGGHNTRQLKPRNIWIWSRERKLLQTTCQKLSGNPNVEIMEKDRPVLSHVRTNWSLYLELISAERKNKFWKKLTISINTRGVRKICTPSLNLRMHIFLIQGYINQIQRREIALHFQHGQSWVLSFGFHACAAYQEGNSIVGSLTATG